MSYFSTWLKTILVCYIVHKAVQYFVYLIFGLEYGYFNPVTLSIHNLRYQSSASEKIEVKVHKIRLHISLLAKKDSYVNLSLSGLVFNLTGIQDENVTNKHDTKRPQQNESISVSDKRFIETLGHDRPYDPNAPVVIFPKDRKLKRLTTFLIKSLPHLSFAVSSTKIVLSSELSVVCEKISGKTDINSLVLNSSFLKKAKNPNNTCTSSLQLENCYLFSKSANQILSKFVGRCETSITFQLALDTGIASSLKIMLRFVEIELSVLYLLKLIKSINPNFKIIDSDNATDAVPGEKPKRIHKYRLYFYGFIFRLLKNASISIQTLSLTEIPATTSKRLNSFLERQDDDSLKDILFMSVKIASTSLEVGPVSLNQVGYSLKFVEGSLPLQWIVTLGNIKLSLNYSKVQNYTGTTKEFDIMFIPNLLFTMESTLLINLLRVVFNSDIEHNFAKQQTITTIQLTLANPSVDISTEQLSILMKAFRERKIDRTGSKHDSSSATPPTPTDATACITEREEQRKAELKRIILNTSPKFQIKLFLEKPLVLIKSENEIVNKRDIHLSTFQLSILSFQIDITTIKRKMNFSVRCDIPDISMIYQRNNLNSSAVTFASLKDSQFKLNFWIFEFSNLSFSLKLGQMSVDLTSLEVINGLSILLNSLKTHMLLNKATLPQEGNVRNDSISKAHLNLFKDLPTWLVEVKFSVNSIILRVGSKSLFIPVDDLLSETNDQNHVIENKVYAPSSVSYKIKKVELELKNHNQDGESDDNPSTRYSVYSKTPEDYYWLLFGKIVDVKTDTNMLHPNLGVTIKENILKIPEVAMNLYCLKNKGFELSSIIDKLNISHSVSSHFTLFSSFYLLKSALFYHHSKFTTNNKPLKSENELSQHEPQTVLQFEFFNIKWHLKEAQLKMLMPQKFNFRLDLLDLKGFANKTQVIMEKRMVRLSVKKHPKSEFFNSFLTFNNMKIIFQLPNDRHELMKMSIHNNNIKISVPSNFVVHSLFDAIILTVKLTKKFVKSVKDGPTKSLDKVTASGTINLPRIKLKSDSLAFMIEDDPFETELGMIYQLGLLEQRVRLEKYKHFKEYIDSIKEDGLNRLYGDERLEFLNRQLDDLYSNPSILNQEVDDQELGRILIDCGRKLHKLRVNISKSWIILVREFKLKRSNMVKSNINFLTRNFASLLSVSPALNSNLVDYTENPSLMGLHFQNFTASINPPKFEQDSGDAHQFLYRVGKGVPKDTKWDKLIPMKIVLTASEVRVHLRDFPLPLVYVPNYKSAERWSNSFILKATLVFSEPLPKSDNEYFYLKIPMFDKIDEDSSLYLWQAPKTITSVKCYYESECEINSDNPTLVTWSTAYQAVLRQLNICFDTFSKAKNDPSPKLGIWDKMRNILHGYLKIRWTDNESEVRINILNSYDPYKILGYNAGFSLVFKKDIEWLLNDPHREFERDYFIFRSKSVLFGIPNHISEPLPCWCSEKLIFLPSDGENFVISSMYGYYLDSDLYLTNDSRLKEIVGARDLEFETHNIYLNGNIELVLSMVFERKLEDGTRTTKFEPHYANTLTSSDKVEDKADFDSYRGFRSDFIHMALKLSAKASTYNILRLTPRSIFHFIGWFKQFSGDIGLPIRNGTLWAAQNESVKLGGHLMTFKFMFDVTPLYIFHGYRMDLTKPDNQTVVGLKAKIGNFRCDLHQRKEKKVKHVDFLDQSYEIMKMVFYIGKVDLDEIDLRVVGLSFKEAGDSLNPLHKFEIFDDDKDWIDLNDYEEVGLPAINNCDITGQIHPLSYASHFCYWMNKKLEANQFGSEDSHDCCIDSKKFPKSKFQHIFDTDKLKFKWYSFVRNLVFEYLAGIEFRAAYVYSTSYSARQAVIDKLQEGNREKTRSDSDRKATMPRFNISNAKDFDHIMRNIGEYGKSTVAVDDMLLRFNDVQLQMMVNPTDDNLVLFRTQHNEIEIISLMDENWIKYIKSAKIAKRFGSIFENADLLIMSKREYTALGKSKQHYGSTTSWPAFLDGDEPESYIKSKTLLSDVLIFFAMEKASNSYAGGKRRNRLYLNVPKFETKIDSQSYMTFFKVTQELMIYASPQQKYFAEMIESLTLATDNTDKHLLLQNLESLSHEIATLLFIHKATTPLRCVSQGQTYFDPYLRQKCSKLFSKALILSKLALQSSDTVEKDSDDECFMEWVITASNINIDFVDKNHTFLNFAMKDSSFSRLEMFDKSTMNEISIKTIQITNKDYNILYPELLTTFNPPRKSGAEFSKLDSMVRVIWELGEKVGGMHNIKNVEIECHPMKLSMEDKTGLKLMRFLFPNEIKSQDSEHNKSDNGSDENDDYSTSSTDATIFDSADEKADSGVDKENKSNDISLENDEANFEEPLKKSDSGDLVDELLSTSDDSKEEPYSDVSNKSLVSFVGSDTAKDIKIKNNIISTYSQKLNKSIVGGKIINTVPTIDNLVKMTTRSRDSELSHKSLSISEMSERAKTFFSIQNFTFANLVLNVTFSGKGKLRLINVNNLTLSVPSFHVSKKIWTTIDMINAVKKHIIKTLLKQTGRLLRNKIFVYKSKKRVNRLKKSVGKH